jgi:hypothetical protein
MSLEEAGPEDIGLVSEDARANPERRCEARLSPVDNSRTIIEIGERPVGVFQAADPGAATSLSGDLRDSSRDYRCSNFSRLGSSLCF